MRGPWRAALGAKEKIGMRGTALVALLLGSALLVGIGCKKDEGSGSGAPAASVDPNSTGVAECDTYLKSMTDCYAGTPQAATMEATMKQMREKFRGDVANGGKDKLKAECLEHSALLTKNPACAKK
jgi:hypothetical protein